MFKIIASDLDGTLLVDHQMDRIVDQTIKMVLANQRYFVLATGRQMHPLHQGAFRYDDPYFYIVANNGATIYDGKGNIVQKSLIDKEFIKLLVATFPNVHFEFICEDGTYIMSDRASFIAGYGKIWKDFYTMLEICKFDTPLAKLLAQDIMKINCNIEDPRLYATIDEFCLKHQELVVNAPFEPCQIEITAAGVDKGSAIKALGKLLQVRDDQIVVYGDGGNDLKMLAAFEHAYVPENGCSAAKRLAKKILAHNDTHSVAKHIQTMLAIE
ncbi:MAG: Cof-type HAD-IIB family hydrolase [Erysipelotrichaceae bacterium]|nr:Cof-type HAD-IIB family hydrolase [Erysipelotrichaceae bacterium]MDY5252103.1 HAD family hydrolase [Erysipelotrichaceae bacterium]